MDFLLPGFTIFYTDRHGLKMIKKRYLPQRTQRKKREKEIRGLSGMVSFAPPPEKRDIVLFHIYGRRF
jgi:hypothetical protein